MAGCQIMPSNRLAVPVPTSTCLKSAAALPPRGDAPIRRMHPKAEEEVNAREQKLRSLRDKLVHISTAMADRKEIGIAINATVDEFQMLQVLEGTIRQLLEEVKSANEQVAETDAALQTATAHALEHLEERASESFEEEWGEEREAMKEALAEAQLKAESAVLEMNESIAAAETRNARIASEAAAALANEVDSIVKISEASAALSAKAADDATATSMRVAKQQAETFTNATSVKKMAIEAIIRADKAQSQSSALQEEVNFLREKLEQVQREAATASTDAVEAERKAGERLQEALDAFARQQKEMEDAYEMFKASEKDRRKRAEEQAREDRLRNEELAAENAHLRETLSAAIDAVAQSRAQAAEANKTAARMEEEVKKVRQDTQVEKEQELETMREALFLDAMQSTQAVVKEDLDGARTAVKRALSQSTSRIQSLEAALRRSTDAKTQYQARAVAAEESLAQIKLKMQVAEEAKKQAQEVKKSVLPGRGRAARYLRDGKQIRNFKANGTPGASLDHSSEAVNGNWTPTDEERGPDGPRPDGAP